MVHFVETKVNLYGCELCNFGKCWSGAADGECAEDAWAKVCTHLRSHHHIGEDSLMENGKRYDDQKRWYCKHCGGSSYHYDLQSPDQQKKAIKHLKQKHHMSHQVAKSDVASYT